MTNKQILSFSILASVVFGAHLLPSTASATPAPGDVLANWRFEQVQRLDGSKTPAVVGASLTGEDMRPVDPRPFAADETGNGNLLQVVEPKDGSNPSPTAFSDKVPFARIDGKPNTRSLALKGRDYLLSLDRVLAFSDLRKGWMIDASVMTNRPEDAQVFLCKDGTSQSKTADLAIGYDPQQRKFYVEVKGADGALHRVTAGGPAEAGKWYDVRATASCDIKTGQTKLLIGVKPAGTGTFGTPASAMFKGPALPKGGAMWAAGRGFPFGQFVGDGGIDEVRISGEGLPRVAGQNPIFTDTFTADPAALVVGDTVYAYVGHDAAGVGMFFHMPEWLCYSSKDMKTWTPHGVIMKPEEFSYARPGVAWAGQVIRHDGKYYFYATLRQKDNDEHCIGVAASDSPTGPFKDARGTPLITDGMTTDSSRPNADIDPTVFIDDDGTPWLMWGNGDFYLAKLKQNMIEFDGPIQKMPHENVAEGPWLFKRNGLYYNVYAADVPGNPPEKIAYATAEKITGPWKYRGLVTGSARNGFTIHPSVIEFKGRWYFFYHDGSTPLKGMPGGDCRRSVCVEYLTFNPDGTIQPITQTEAGVSVQPRN
jgi:hypothetical protein